MSLFRFFLRRAARLIGVPIHRKIARFERDCQQPEKVQTELLSAILHRQAGTGFGRDHGFSSMKTVQDFRRQVPAAPYEYLTPYIERLKRGETEALIADDQVLLFALTSGTTAARKLIPITKRYLADYRRGWNMWGARAYRDHRGRKLFLRPIVQMGGDPEEFRTEADIPCGNLSGYTAMVQKRIIRWLYALPPDIGKVKEAEARYYLALRCSIGRPCSMFLAANPSTLLAMARTLEARADDLIRDLANGTLHDGIELPASVRQSAQGRLKANPERARELSDLLQKQGRLLPKDVWPDDTTLIGTWTGGSMGPYLRMLPDYFGQPPVRDLGLLASEGRMTIPFDNHSPVGVLDIWSHYFEFVPEGEIDQPRPTFLGAHELELDKNYYLLPTTHSGLYRYQIFDLVRVSGFLGKTPMVEFLGKGNRFANLTGEKLSEHQSSQAGEEAARDTGYSPGGFTLAPVWQDDRPYYALFVEDPGPSEQDRLRAYVQAFEAALQRLNIEYEAKRQSGRLGPLQALLLPPGTWSQWDQDRLRKTGGSPEQYKHPTLIGDINFRNTMPVTGQLGS